MTTANKITVLRILLVPFFIVQVVEYGRTHDELHRLLAILTFAIVAISDGIDGYIARRYNQRSELGAMLDPLADKMLLVSGVILLSRSFNPYFERIPVWLTTTILSRDALLVIGLVVIHYTFGKIKVRPRFTGKISTVLQMATVLWTLLQWRSDIRYYLALGAAIFTGVSGALYVLDGMRQLGDSPTSGPAEEK